ncbi:MAG: hypothetical protein K2Y40_09300 [Reyranella sp.]|jgi:hypothetical protein|nr:hypothetical protein [Reyranella sp.]
MRTTLTLDPDVAARLKRLRQRRDAGLKEVVNDVLREGLRSLEEKPRTRRKAWTKPLDLGESLIGPLDNVAEALAIAEGEAFR